MEKTEILLEHVTTKQRRKPPPREKAAFSFGEVSFGKKLLLSCGIFSAGFLWGRAEVLQLFHPLGMAYLSSFFGEGFFFLPAFLGTGLGSVSHSPLKTAVCLVSALLLQALSGKRLSRSDKLRKPLLGAFCTGIAGIVSAVSEGGLMFYFVLALVEAAWVFLIGLAVEKGIRFFLAPAEAPWLSKSESLSLLLLLTGSLGGIASFQTPALKTFLLPSAAAFFLLAAARKEGLGGGAAAGVLTGLMLLLTDSADLTLFAALSLGGMLSGWVSEKGKFLSAVAMVLPCLLFLFYMDAELLEPVWMAGLASGTVLFLLLPEKVFSLFAPKAEEETPKDQYLKMKELNEEKLRHFSTAFEALAKTFRQEDGEGDGEPSRLVDLIAERTCEGCGMCRFCWEEELYNTYSMTFSALTLCNGKGKLTQKQLPESFLRTCTRAEAFIRSINEVSDLCRRDKLWKDRLAECRELAGEQLLAVGGILKELSGRLEFTGTFLEETETELFDALKKAGIRPKALNVTEENNRRSVSVTLPSCGGGSFCKEKLLPIVKKTLGCPMVLLGGSCGNAFCTLRFLEEPPFALTMAAAVSPARKGCMAGDAAAFLETEQGTAVMALSDGMGTGEKAARESHAAIELLEQFTEAGFDRELSVRMINSALLLRKGEESYATLDILGADLFSGKAEFLKLGAVASFIRRQERIISIRSAALPAGILKQVRAEKNEFLLKDGDMIFLMTDGVTDALGGETAAALWLKDRLSAFPMSNPQDAAAYVLKEAAKERKDGRTDDMTVLAGRFWRKCI